MKGEKERFSFLMKDIDQGFSKYIGLRPVSMEEGRFVTRLILKKHHLQQDGFVHAGVMAAMADHTAGYASFTLVPPDRRILTVEYKINYLKPASGDYLECRSRVIKPGKQILVAESEIYAVKGNEESLVAKALLTMAAVPQNRL